MRNDTPQIFKTNFKAAYAQEQSICVFVRNKLKCFFFLLLLLRNVFFKWTLLKWIKGGKCSQFYFLVHQTSAAWHWQQLLLWTMSWVLSVWNDIFWAINLNVIGIRKLFQQSNTTRFVIFYFSLALRISFKCSLKNSTITHNPK